MIPEEYRPTDDLNALRENPDDAASRLRLLTWLLSDRQLKRSASAALHPDLRPQMDTDDLVAITLKSLCEPGNLRRIAELGTEPGRSKVRVLGYAKGMNRKNVITILRRPGVGRAQPQTASVEIEGRETPPSQQAMAKEERESYERELHRFHERTAVLFGRLEPGQREIIVKKYRDKKSLTQISEGLGGSTTRGRVRTTCEGFRWEVARELGFAQSRSPAQDPGRGMIIEMTELLLEDFFEKHPDGALGRS